MPKAVPASMIRLRSIRAPDREITTIGVRLSSRQAAPSPQVPLRSGGRSILVQGAAARGALALALPVALFPARFASAAPGDRLSADATFESYDPTGCINTEVAVFVRSAKVDGN